MEVEYREIKDHPGYRIGNNGSVWTAWTTANQYKDSEIGTIWKYFKPSIDKDQRETVSLRHAKGYFHRVAVHSLVLEAFVGPCPPGMECCHWDGNTRNNWVWNLRWDTHINNMADKERHGTTTRLAQVTIDAILLMEGTQQEIASTLGIRQGTVSKYKRMEK